uniref:Interferon induced transmembrane protein 10 n=1 Tax=Anolis carolinensis TaxID=28377 RepID=A0A803SNR8_ANOCA
LPREQDRTEGAPEAGPRPATLVSLRRMPRDYLVWSLFTFFYGNFCCLGLAALVFSIKSRDAKVLGDVESAEEHGKTDRCLSVVALALAIVSMIVSIIVMATSMDKRNPRLIDRAG